MSAKTCSACGKAKGAEAFTAGHARCNNCRAQVQAEWQAGKGADYHRARQRDYKAANPDKTRAHREVATAVMKGQLEVPTGCSRCGDMHHRLEAHHADHDKPLAVEFLCPGCHRATRTPEPAHEAPRG